MHFVLHDFSNDFARRILYNIALGMAPNRSRLLLDEIVFPTRDSPLQMALLDVQMMVLLGGRERTESEWKELVEEPYEVGEAVRLEVVQVWTSPRGAGEGIIEILRRA